MERGADLRRILFIFALAALACAGTVVSPPATSTPLPTLPPGAIRLHVGESGVVSGGMTITFVGVSDDSRCPRDVECFWAGTATVELTFETTDGVTGPLELVFGGLPPTGAEVGGVTVDVIDLLPYPLSTQEINPGEYVVTLDIAAR